MNAADHEHMKLAVKEACDGVNLGDGGPFGAAIVRDGNVIATGHNMVLVTNDPTMHAEVVAIRNACKKIGSFDLSGCTLYTSCYPCPMCMGACLWARLSAIYYGATAEEASTIGFDDKPFYDFIRNPRSDQKRKLERLSVADYLQPFDLWVQKASSEVNACLAFGTTHDGLPIYQATQMVYDLREQVVSQRFEDPWTETGPSGKDSTRLPPTSAATSIAGHHPNGHLTSSGPPVVPGRA
ncbi:hypothetical protein KIN20_035677 [Parelaphostrongylus tenuis]|uniref:CMP/dCMP-type deaminase domain-containing protein n=1 Tax=Parelaphostrongylus tenuis TaxID=148309 RepID=A0AAD5WKM8_PARTN|nr:hypothetical protein KIN20_035677 [Parelaphostrongylus tenuis]